MKKQATIYCHLYVGSEAETVLNAIRALCVGRHLVVFNERDIRCDIALSITPNQGPVEVEAGIGWVEHETISLLGLLQILRETNTPPKPKFIETRCTDEGWLSSEPLTSKAGNEVDWYTYRVFKTGVQVVSDDSNHHIVGWIPRVEIEGFTKAFKQLDQQAKA